MSQVVQLEPTPTLASTSMPGVEVVAAIRNLLAFGLVAVTAYSMMTTASQGFCPGGVDADGNFLDAAGHTVDVAPTCISLTLGPSPLVLVAIAVTVLVALTIVIRRASDVSSAIRVLKRAGVVIGLIAVASIVISQVWFAMIPITDWNGTGTFFFPAPFGSVQLETSPMTVG